MTISRLLLTLGAGVAFAYDGQWKWLSRFQKADNEDQSWRITN